MKKPSNEIMGLKEMYMRYRTNDSKSEPMKNVNHIRAKIKTLMHFVFLL